MRTIIKQIPIIVDGKVIGQSIEGWSEEGDPVFGRCVAIGCPSPATNETLTALHFCDTHFLKFYSPDQFQIDRAREFSNAE